jgi:hypothetical protein
MQIISIIIVITKIIGWYLSKSGSDFRIAFYD